MLNTKLIFIEGISGSGKSTITGFISDLLTQYNIDHNAYFEWEENHPICVEDDVWLNEDKKSSLYRYRELNYKKWLEHITDLVNSDKISIFDSSLMQTPLNAFILLLNENFKTIRDFYKILYKMFHVCSPYLIYLRQNDVYSTISRVYSSRPKEWGDFVIKYICKSPYGKEKCLRGFDGMVKYFSERQAIEDKLFWTYPFKKLQIDNSDFDFEKCKDKIREFLDL